MLLDDTKNKIAKLKLKGMLIALEEQLNMPVSQELSFDDRLGMLVDREILERENHKLQIRLGKAKLKENAFIENFDFKNSRGVDKNQILNLATGNWIQSKQNIIITGPTGAGKTFLANALAQKACRLGFSALYYRSSRIFEELNIAKADGTLLKILDKLAKPDVLILDDFGLNPLNPKQRSDLLEIVDSRIKLSSIIFVSQIPHDKWFDLIGDPTFADAILDRILHNSHLVQLNGDSMRKILHPTQQQNIS